MEITTLTGQIKMGDVITFEDLPWRWSRNWFVRAWQWIRGEDLRDRSSQPLKTFVVTGWVTSPAWNGWLAPVPSDETEI